MRTDPPNLPDSVRTHFDGLGYRYLYKQYPDFGGIVIYLQRKGSEQEAAYYISKPSIIELVTSDELGQVLDFFEESNTRLQHVVTTSPFSSGSLKLATEAGMTLWELQYRYVEVVPTLVDESPYLRERLIGTSL